MAKKLALFSSSGNDIAYYPDTPFLILYSDPARTVTRHQGQGVISTGGNSFVAREGKTLYVPLQSVDDSPPVLGTFPRTAAQAKRYFFDADQGYGGRGYKVIVDGLATPLGASYVSRPVTSPPLLDGGGTHSVSIGAFLRPLRRGLHTVTIVGSIHGSLLLPTYGISFARETFTYTVKVLPAR